MKELPILAITTGDPSGIGPEIVAKSFLHTEIYAVCRPLLTGDSAVVRHIIAHLGLDLRVNPIQRVEEARFEQGTIDVYDIPCMDMSLFQFGEEQAQCGHAAFLSVKAAIDLAMRNEVDGTVTAPLNKSALHKGGHLFDGHTEIYATFTHTKKYAMLLADEYLRVIHVSTHVPLRKACDLVKKARIIEVTELLDDACRQFGIPHPRIGIAGLNPHASDSGLFGTEEAEEIEPAVSELRQRGYDVTGPVPPDSLFAKAKCGQFDGCVAMYHDQGHIPFKVVGFNWNKETGKMDSVKGVNITLGLPIIRVSVDHGTAFDVAGRGVASEDALLLSIDYAQRMARHRKGMEQS